jgi:predicted anti-sigma-YlaC factor YlaD
MNCRDFKEIADSYLSDELAVETNHEVFQHLENCANCRQELSMRRELREKLKDSLKNSTEFQMNPAFAVRLRANLKDEALRKNSWFSWRILTPLFASFLMIFGLTFVFIYHPNQTSFAAELSKKAINQHEYCGLKNAKKWEAQAGKVPAEKTVFAKSLQDENTEILEVHNCKFEGKTFTHYILRHNGKIISVLKTASENVNQTNLKTEDSIVCEREKGWQVSRFTIDNETVFVVSDMSEAENLQIARKLSDSVKS